MPKTYKHLDVEERDILAVLKSQGHSLREIATILNRSPSTLCRLFDVARGVEARSSDLEMNDFPALGFQPGRFLKHFPYAGKGNVRQPA